MLTLVRNSHARERPRVIKCGRTFSMPGVECEHCAETWACSGSIFPGARVSQPLLRSTRDERVVNLNAFEALRSRVSADTGVPEALIEPGSEFGPLTLSVACRPPRVYWFLPGVLLFDEEARDEVKSSLGGGAVAFVPVQLKLPGTGLLPYYELDLGFDVHVHPDSSHGGGDCLRCRRVNFVGGEGLLIDQACREHPNPSRIFELPTHVVAPEPVAHAIVNADRRATILSALRFA